MSSTEFTNIKEYVKEVTERFDIAQKGARVGLMRFSDKSKLDIKLSDHDLIEDFNVAVDKLTLLDSSGPLRIDNALKHAYDELFSQQNGGRRNVQQLLIVVTAEESNQGPMSDSLSMMFESIHEAGIKLMVVGLGNGKKNGIRMESIASGRDNVLRVNPKLLNSIEFIDNTTTRACLNTGKYLVIYYYIRQWPSVVC